LVEDSDRSCVLVLDPSRPIGEAVVGHLAHAGIDARWSATWSPTPAPDLTLCAADLLFQVPAGQLKRVVVAARDLTAGVLRTYLLRGMPAVVDRAWPADRVAHVVAEAAGGRSVVPSHLLRVAITGQDEPVDLDLTAEERSWLEAFAEGRSSGWVARQAHISERQLYRRLNSVYERLGVSNRSAAIAVLSRCS
jgi:DNA-binding NarL/FixJ family response regulator